MEDFQVARTWVHGFSLVCMSCVIAHGTGGREVLGGHLSFISVAVMKFPDRNDKGEGGFPLAPNSRL